MKTSELTGAALDWAVAKCEGLVDVQLLNARIVYDQLLTTGRLSKGQQQVIPFQPSTDWAQGGPIIERGKVVTSPNPSGGWYARSFMDAVEHFGSTPLIAACRCYVASILGDDIEVDYNL